MSKQLFDLDAFRAQPLPTESEIIVNWQGDIDKPVVSVLCHAFNHEHFIEDTLRGILFQKTDFPFEVIVNDDFSTDKTLKIIEKHQDRYPNLIKVIKHESNMFSLGVRPSNYSLAIAKGEYICICEGDDFWNIQDKLSLHINFFKDNPIYTLHVTDAVEVDTNMQVLSNSKIKRMNIKLGHLSQEYLLSNFALLPLSSCFKNIFKLPFPRYYNKSINGDSIYQYELTKVGPAYVDSKVTSTYLHHAGGIWSQERKIIKFFETAHTSLVLTQADFHKKNELADAKPRLHNLIFELINLVGWKSFFKAFMFKATRKLFR